MTLTKQFLGAAVVAILAGLLAYTQGHPDVASWTFGGAVAAVIAAIVAKVQGK